MLAAGSMTAADTALKFRLSPGLGIFLICSSGRFLSRKEGIQVAQFYSSYQRPQILQYGARSLSESSVSNRLHSASLRSLAPLLL